VYESELCVIHIPISFDERQQRGIGFNNDVLRRIGKTAIHDAGDSAEAAAEFGDRQ
jgi:hypothetical protein